MARLRLGRADVLRLGLFRADVRVCRAAHWRRSRLCGQPHRRRDSRLSRDADGAGPEQPAPQPAAGGEPRPASAHARRRVSGWRPRAARRDRHGVAEHQHAGSDAVPDPARDASSDRRRLVHLSDLRLRAPDLGCDRGHHALALHARVRGSSSALRLGRGPHQPGHRVPVAAAADRIRAAQSELHRS